MGKRVQEQQEDTREPLRRLERWTILPFLFILDLFLGYGCPRIQHFWTALFYWLSYPFMGAKRRIAAANLAIAFPELSEQERHRLLKRNMRYVFELGLDWLHFFMHPEVAEKRIDLGCHPELEKLRNRPTDAPGVIFCTPHLGNWELEAHISFLTCRKGAVIAATFNSSLLNRLIAHFRLASRDTTFIPVRGAARGMLRAWKEKRDLGLLIDQNLSPRHGGIFVPFFGLGAVTSNLPATLAKHLGARIYITACVKKADGNFALEIEALPEAEKFSSPEELTAAIMKGYERVIRRHPEQYLWLYPRWRYIPSNASEEYRKRFPFYARLRNYEAPDEIIKS